MCSCGSVLRFLLKFQVSFIDHTAIIHHIQQHRERQSARAKKQTNKQKNQTEKHTLKLHTLSETQEQNTAAAEKKTVQNSFVNEFSALEFVCLHTSILVMSMHVFDHMCAVHHLNQYVLSPQRNQHKVIMCHSILVSNRAAYPKNR